MLPWASDLWSNTTPPHNYPFALFVIVPVSHCGGRVQMVRDTVAAATAGLTAQQRQRYCFGCGLLSFAMLALFVLAMTGGLEEPPEYGGADDGAAGTSGAQAAPLRSRLDVRGYELMTTQSGLRVRETPQTAPML